MGFDLVIKEKLDSLEVALPEGLNKDRFALNFYEAVKSNNTLVNICKQPAGRASVLSCMVKAAVLDLDATNGEFYLVPYGNQAQFITSPQGARKLVEKYSKKPVKDFSAFVVREGDEFSYTNNNGEKGFDFKPIAFNDKPIVGAVAYCRFTDETMQIEVMSKNDIEAARKQSKAKNSPAWVNFYDRMAIKSAIHRLCKSITLEFENKDQVDAFLSGSEIDNTAKAEKPKTDNPFADDIEVEAEVIEPETVEVVEAGEENATEE